MHRLSSYFKDVNADVVDEVVDRDMTEADKDEFIALFNSNNHLSDDEFGDLLGISVRGAERLREFHWGRTGAA